MKDTNEMAEHRATATTLYEQFTSYDTFLFIFFYRDLTTILSRTSKLLQARDIQIRDVGCKIMTLCVRLKELYQEDSTMPVSFIGEGVTDNILSELFGQDLNGNPLKYIRVYTLELDCLEEELHRQESEESVSFSFQSTRVTREVNISQKYTSLLSRKCKEQTQTQSLAVETQILQAEKEVIFILSRILKIV